MATRTAGQAATRRLFVAKATFATAVNGVPTVVHAGDIVEAGDPILKGRDSHFEAFEPKVRRFGPGRVEKATAAPGEVRE